MLEWINGFLAARDMAPHGYCLLWDPVLIWTHFVSDALIALAYFSIPVVLWQLLSLRRDVQFGWMLGLFAVFILACGMTHVMGMVTLWVPAYGWQAVVKAITAVASVGTAVVLIPLLPRLLAIPSPAALQAANEALTREAHEREKTETMLRQSQKMEALGKLTGGVAHDFNNILAVIIANLDRAKRMGTEASGLSKALDNALSGAERGAKLIDQLLAFSRQQPLKRQLHDVNELVSATAELISETMGGQVEVKLDLTNDLPPTSVDRNQLENALLNLAINGRDAMESGGVLVFSTRFHGEAQDLIELGVADNGSGMDAETLERAIDPFFTTKPVGKGSGLGLSQVVGTIEQLGGHVKIDSFKGTGTTVRLYIPVQQKRGSKH